MSERLRHNYTPKVSGKATHGSFVPSDHKQSVRRALALAASSGHRFSRPQIYRYDLKFGTMRTARKQQTLASVRKLDRRRASTGWVDDVVLETAAARVAAAAIGGRLSQDDEMLLRANARLLVKAVRRRNATVPLTPERLARLRVCPLWPFC